MEDIKLKHYENAYGIEQIALSDAHNTIFNPKNKISSLISKLSKFVEGDDRHELLEQIENYPHLHMDNIESILKDYIILKRPTDETGK